MIENALEKFNNKFKFNETQKIKKSNRINNFNMIYNLIESEFKKDYIRKLYPNPKWTTRIFWVSSSSISDENNIELYEVIKVLHSFLLDENLPLPDINWNRWIAISDEWIDVAKLYGNSHIKLSQRDMMKLIHDIIGSGCDIHVATDQAQTRGISFEMFDSSIRQMKREGRIFEPREGYYKVI